MIKVIYRVFGDSKEYTATVDLKSTDDLREVVKQHTTSSRARLFNTDLPDATVSMTTNGVINTFVYNKGEGIVKFLNDPKSIYDKVPDFPVNISSELKAEIEERLNEQPD